MNACIINVWGYTEILPWQRVRSVKFPIIEVGEVFKEYELDKVQPLTRPITEMDALTLNYWLSILIQEMAKCSKDPYPLKIRCTRFLQLSPIHGGKEPSHRVQSLGLFRQKLRELALLEREPFSFPH